MTIVGEVHGEGCSADNDAAADLRRDDLFNYDFVSNNLRQIARSGVGGFEVGAGFKGG